MCLPHLTLGNLQLLNAVEQGLCIGCMKKVTFQNFKIYAWSSEVPCLSLPCKLVSRFWLGGVQH